MEVTGRVLIATIIALIVVLILVVAFHIYAKWLWHRRQQGIDTSNNRRHQEQHAGVTVLRRGLDAAFLKTLPVIQFDSKDFKDGLECSVCLTELEQGEKTRVLPKCNHAFHAECIDMWFHSHSTCPICRNSVSEQTEVSVESLLENHAAEEPSRISGDFPTNVLFWGDEMEVSSLTSQLVEANNNNNHQASVLPFEPTSASSSASASASSSSAAGSNKDRLKPDLVIDIPRAGQGSEEEDARTPIMRSLRRILSTSRRFNPFSPGSEQAQS
ncbi:RING-H2 finger protein ATL60-like [Bidens hawaiensis]|uniref:RING-H2 finger protein ATL60-like n=1 Tax=Bidens hawaiensis TaxID=980011 RepID=UPI00404AE9A1